MDINYPAKVVYLLRNQADSPVSVTFGPRIPESLKKEFTSYDLPENFAKYQVHSSFIVNYWRIITSLAIVLSVGTFFAILEVIARRNSYRTVANVMA